MQPLQHGHDPIAELKLLIVSQRELAARLCRKGDHDGARQARAKLFNMEDKLDVLEEMVRPFR
jgi:hypothetical protein